jgi:hypothetical protein
MKTYYVLTPKQIRKVVEQEIKWHQKMKGLSKKSKNYETGFLAGLKQIKRIFDEKNFMFGMSSEEFERLGKRIADLPEGERKDL